MNGKEIRPAAFTMSNEAWYANKAVKGNKQMAMELLANLNDCQRCGVLSVVEQQMDMLRIQALLVDLDYHDNE